MQKSIIFLLFWLLIDSYIMKFPQISNLSSPLSMTLSLSLAVNSGLMFVLFVKIKIRSQLFFQILLHLHEMYRKPKSSVTPFLILLIIHVYHSSHTSQNIPFVQMIFSVQLMKLLIFLSVISKLLERHIYNILLDFVQTHSSIADNQFGVLPSRSTSLALLFIFHSLNLICTWFTIFCLWYISWSSYSIWLCSSFFLDWPFSLLQPAFSSTFMASFLSLLSHTVCCS